MFIEHQHDASCFHHATAGTWPVCIDSGFARKEDRYQSPKRACDGGNLLAVS